MKKAREFIMKIFTLLMKPEMRILPGQLAFFLVLTIIPLMALIATIAASLSISADTVRVAIENSIPSDVAGILNSIINGHGINFNIMVFYISAFLLASNGTLSMINTSNEIYKIEPSNIIRRRTKAIIMTFILVGLFFFLILVPIFGSTVSNIIRKLTDDSTIIRVIQEMLVILKYPLIVIILFLNIKMMYVIAPDQDIPTKTTNKGAIFTTLGWVLTTEVFAFYIEKFGRYDLFYGSISNILVLLIWIYLLSYIYVFGMVINASDYNEYSSSLIEKEETK